MNEDYTQPFYVGHSPEMQRRFPHAKFGMLPPLELPLRQDLFPIECRVEQLEDRTSQPGAIPRQYQYKLQSLSGEVLHLSKILTEHLTPKEKPTPQKESYKGIR